MQKIKKTFKVKNLNDFDDDIGYFEADLAVYNNIDNDNEIIKSGAFNYINPKEKITLLSDHDPKVVIGHYFADMSNPNLLRIKGHFNFERDPKTNQLLVPKAGEKYANLKNGDISGFSAGFFYSKDSVKYEEINGKRVLTYVKGLELKEGSVVTFPANDRAKLSFIKSSNDYSGYSITSKDYKWNEKEAEKRVRDFTQSNEKPSDEYKKYFMFIDEENKDSFEAYKFLFVDIVDNEAFIVPEAILAIANYFQNKDSDLEINEIEEKRIKNQINNIYEIISNKFDDKEFVSPFKSKSLDGIENIRDVEAILKDYGFSSKGAKTLISKIKGFKEVDSRDEMKLEGEVLKERDAELNALSNTISGLEQKLSFESINQKLEKIINKI